MEILRWIAFFATIGGLLYLRYHLSKTFFPDAPVVCVRKLPESKQEESNVS